MFEKTPKTESEFLGTLRKQVEYLQKRLKEEVVFKVKLIKQNSALKKALVLKDQQIFGLNERLNLLQYQRILDESKALVNKQKAKDELSARQMVQKFKEAGADDKSNKSDYISPDDLPDKRLSIFDTSRDEMPQPTDQTTSRLEPNSLYYLEHENSH